LGGNIFIVVAVDVSRRRHLFPGDVWVS
jgi:hypothetical protein